VAEVDRVLGRPRGIRIGEEPDRDGQYFHYLAMWLYALAVLARYIPSCRRKGIELVRQIHDAFVLPRRGVVWKMQEDLSGPYPGYGLGALDSFDGYVSYRMLDERELAREIADMRELIDLQSADLVVTQDLGIGMMLWMCHFFPEEPWARVQKRRCLSVLDSMWIADGVRLVFTDHWAQISPTASIARIGMDRTQLVVEGRNPGAQEREQEVTKTVMVRCAHKRAINPQ